MSRQLDQACSRCGERREGLQRAPYPGELGEELLQRVCRSCWDEWREMEVRVINELRLNFMDPAAQEKLARQLRAFLFPADPPADE
ncbi:MAG: Fe-S cluster protector protein [Acidobacteria bacterium]|nr:MAG: Fe-S cluster protector protein [Acidobacteriota bacterium]REK11648.1 MAG: Fe-S cluster protector protein [Acidobacteriota bacterium]